MTFVSTLRGLLASLALIAVFAAPQAADAYVVNVGGVNFDVVEVDVPGTPFINNVDVLTNSVGPAPYAPWWNAGAAKALEFADALMASAMAPITGAYFFGYGADVEPVTGASTIDYAYFDADAGTTGFGAILANATLGGDESFMVAVPEINGSVLAQVALVLMALYLGSVALRRRDDFV